MIAARDEGSSINRLYTYYTDNGLSFLINTGADVSVLTWKLVKSRTQITSITRYTANDAAIQSYGEKLLTLNLGFRRPIGWKFIIADLLKPNIEADLIPYYGLVVEMRV